MVRETVTQRGARVLASLSYPWQRLGYRIEFRPGARGLLGLTVPDERLVRVYVRAGESDLVLRHSIAHELGHVLDFTRGNPATHAVFFSLRGADPAAVVRVQRLLRPPNAGGGLGGGLRRLAGRPGRTSAASSRAPPQRHCCGR